MKPWISRLYPPHDEIAVFLMSVAIIVLATISPEVSAWVQDGLGKYAHGVRQFVSETRYSLESVADAFFGLILLPMLLLASLAAALFLPFTTRDLRQLCVIIALLHALMMITANFVALQQDPHLLNVVFLAYAMSWIVVIRLRDPQTLISDRQAHPLEGLYYAIAFVLLLVIMLRWLDLHWAIAYSLSITTIGHMRGSVDKLLGLLTRRRTTGSAR